MEVMTACDNGDSYHLLQYLTSFPIWSHHAWPELTWMAPHQSSSCFQSLLLPLHHSFQVPSAATLWSLDCSGTEGGFTAPQRSFQPPKHKASSQELGPRVSQFFGDHHPTWRIIFLFPLGILGHPQTPFLLTLISSEPNPQVLDWIPHPSGNKIHQVYLSHSVSSQTWALFFHGFWDSVTQYSVSGLSPSKPWYILWLSTKKATGGAFTGN